ncbi:MAG: hypothetical protein EZS28_039128, partial [Streblomastix strix]
RITGVKDYLSTEELPTSAECYESVGGGINSPSQ